MKTKISELMDLYEPDCAAETADGISAEKIAKMTQNRINGAKTAKKRGSLRSLRIALIAAAVTVLIIGSAIAVDAYNYMSFTISTEEALAKGNRELDTLRELGVISADLVLDEEHCEVTLGHDMESYFKVFSRDFEPYFLIKYGGYTPLRETALHYTAEFCISTRSDKIISFDIHALADEDAVPVREMKVDDGTENGRLFPFYDNFEDIFDPTMTVDQLCRGLCTYWGFEGYELGAVTGDQGDTWLPPEGELLLTDAGALESGFNRFGVYFDGDKKGTPRYVELHCFGFGAFMRAGIFHSLG